MDYLTFAVLLILMLVAFYIFKIYNLLCDFNIILSDGILFEDLGMNNKYA